MMRLSLVQRRIDMHTSIDFNEKKGFICDMDGVGDIPAIARAKKQQEMLPVSQRQYAARQGG